MDSSQKEWILIILVMIGGVLYGGINAEKFYSFGDEEFSEHDIINFSQNTTVEIKWGEIERQSRHVKQKKDSITIEDENNRARWSSQYFEADKVNYLEIYTDLDEGKNSKARLEIPFFYSPYSQEFYMDFELRDGKNRFGLLREYDSDYFQIKFDLEKYNSTNNPEIKNITVESSN